MQYIKVISRSINPNRTPSTVGCVLTLGNVKEKCCRLSRHFRKVKTWKHVHLGTEEILVGKTAKWTIELDCTRVHLKRKLWTGSLTSHWLLRAGALFLGQEWSLTEDFISLWTNSPRPGARSLPAPGSAKSHYKEKQLRVTVAPVPGGRDFKESTATEGDSGWSESLDRKAF